MKIEKKEFDENRYKIINGDSLVVLDTLEENSIDAIITDPPYELGFMGKGWDKSGIAYNVELWKKALRVLKNGGYLLAFGGSRTYHRIACAIEDAGFEIRDTIMWLYGSGFPKSMNIGLMLDKKNGIDNRTGIIKTDGAHNGKHFNLAEKETMKSVYEERKATNEWNGWGTALKPAFEPIIVARKPVDNSIVDNVIKYGVGGINIDECRVPLESDYKAPKRSIESQNNNNARKGQTQCDLGGKGENAGASELGRFPANVILTYDDSDFDEVCGGFPQSDGSQGKPFSANDYEEHETATNFKRGDFNPYNDSGSASRYFYCAKASKKDRDGGMFDFDLSIVNDGRNKPIDNAFNRGETLRKNTHPTVKPTTLMQYLVRLVTPNNGTILDPFNGSGSTGKAVMCENKERNKNYKYIGIELTEEYLPISKARIEYVCNLEDKKESQLTIFDLENNNE